MIDSLGKPGIDNDLQLLGSGSQWELVWTQPKLTIEQTREIISKRDRKAEIKAIARRLPQANPTVVL